MRPYAAIGFPLGVIVQKFLRRYKKAGKCVLTDQEIIVMSGENQTRYRLSEVTGIKLYFRGYQWMDLKPTESLRMVVPNFSDGACNELVFLHEGTEVRIGLKFYRRHLDEMNVLFTSWAEQGVSYELYGRKQVGRKWFRV